MKTLIIDRVKFLNWYFEDGINKDELYDLSNDVSKLNELLDTTGYIPDWILVGGQEYTLDENGDVDESNVEFIFN